VTAPVQRRPELDGLRVAVVLGLVFFQPRWSSTVAGRG
jgi:hypothetical protein